MINMAGNGQVTVPPGFRFHPTDEELLYYYLRKKVAYETIDLDVIRDIDLNKLEPWDLKDKCRIGNGPQNEWYFFCHKDKKYPTGTRTNRATMAGFWKATGRDKAIHLSNARRIGMRKTLVFYTGRAPHGQKTDWIMHEYRLEDDHSEVQEDGWVVCRVFMKKSHQKGPLQSEIISNEEEPFNPLQQAGGPAMNQKHPLQTQYDFALDNSMHLPQLLSPESTVTPLLPAGGWNNVDLECSHSLMKLGGGGGGGGGGTGQQQERFHGDWSFLDKLLASHQSCSDHQLFHSKWSPPAHPLEIGSSLHRLPFNSVGLEADFIKYSK